jgi:hypothetical protein
VNLAGVSYYSTEQPFLNIVKSAGSSSNLGATTGWYTASASAWDTSEEAYLQLDANGYPTSLVASPTPPGGQRFTFAKTLVNFNMPAAPPGATAIYPPGTYRLKFEGRGTVQVAGDASYAAGNTCPSNLALSNSSANTYASCTFTVSSPGSSAGLVVQITAIDSNTDYPRDISIVQAVYAGDYDNGAVFNPAFIAAITGFDSLRFMDWNNTNNEFTPYTVSGQSIAQGATAATLTAAWPYPSGTYSIVFIDGERRSASFTLNSATVTWSGGLSNAIAGTTWGSQQNYCNLWVINKSWIHRALPSNAFWGLAAGVPLEVEVALANQIAARPHFNVPLMYGDSDIESMGQLVMSGAGMQTGYQALNSSLSAAFELSNEVWNYGFQQAAVAASLGGNTWPTQPSGSGNYAWNRNYFGMRSAQMASDLQNGVGSTVFGRVIPVLAAQAAGPYSASSALQSSYWSAGPASKYPLKAIAIAPYWGGNPSASDCTEMTGQSDGGLADFFATLTSQTGANGASYTSVPSGGWLGQAESWIRSYATLMASYPGMSLIAYEGGQNFYATSSGTCAGWTTLVIQAERNARMGAAYTTYLDYWKSEVGGTISNVNNLYNDVGYISQYGAWGLLESVMQTISPLSSAPPKYNAVVSYVEQ